MKLSPFYFMSGCDVETQCDSFFFFFLCKFLVYLLKISGLKEMLKSTVYKVGNDFSW